MKLQELKDCVLELKRLRGGIPQLLFISDIDHASTIQLRKIITEDLSDKKEIDFIINSPGGDPDDGYRIIRMLRSNYETVNIIVPFWAKSSATLLTLGGTKIILDEFGELGPLDMQLGHIREDGTIGRESALIDEYSLKRIQLLSQDFFSDIYLTLFKYNRIGISKVELSKQIFEYLSNFYQPLLKQIDPYKLGDKNRKLDIAKQYAKRILLLYNDISADNRERLIDYLVNACPDHGFVVDKTVLSTILPNVISPEDFGGKDYKINLNRLSLSLMEMEDGLSHIGFIQTGLPTTN